MFFNEIAASLGEDLNALKNFCYVNVANLGLVVYGKNSIVYYSSCKIILKCNKTQIFVYGHNLKIASMSATEFCVKGEIFCVSNSEVQPC